MSARPLVLSFAFATIVFAAAHEAAAQATPIKPQASTNSRAVGSWFGRAIPSNTVCTKAQDPSCPVPNEIIMVYTVNEDRTFIGIDSNIFAGGSHSTAHGEWGPYGPNAIKARFTLLQQAPNGTFLGGFTNLFQGNMTDDDTMEGTLDAHLYLYTNASGAAVIGADGLPTPSPLDAPTCVAPLCQHLGIFSFKAKRVKSGLQ